MTVKQLREKLSEISDEETLSMDVTLMIEDEDVIEELMDKWKESLPEEPSQEELDDMYYKICHLLRSKLTCLDVRSTTLPFSDADSHFYLVAGGIMDELYREASKYANAI